MPKECHVALDEIWDQLESKPELLEAMFGDHCRVTITKDAVSVDEYDHD